MPLMPTTAITGSFNNAGMVVLYDQTLPADTASFDVQNIPQGYKHLLIYLSARSSKSAIDDALLMRFNGDTGTNYAFQDIYSANAGATNASGAGAFSQTSAISLECPANSAPANTPGAYVMEIPDYASSVFNKMILTRTGARTVASGAGFYKETSAGNWNSTSPINRITVYFGTGNFKTGSRLTIYGMGGAPAAPSQYSTDDILAQAQGFITQTYSRGESQTSTASSSGDMDASLMGIKAGSIITNVHYTVASAQASTTVCKVGIWDVSGSLVASSANDATKMQSTLLVTFPLSTPYRVTADAPYYVGVVAQGGGGHNLVAITATDGGLMGARIGNVPPMTYLVGQSDIASNLTLTNNSNRLTWFAVS
jgi:hypothetical protein